MDDCVDTLEGGIIMALTKINYNIFEEERKKKPIKAPKVLGIDEKHIANRMRGTLVDVENLACSLF